MCWNPKYSLLIAFSTLTTYLSGLFIDKSNHMSDKKEFFAATFGIIILIFVDYLGTKYNLTDKLSEQNLLFRWSIYIITILVILVFGIYAPGYNDAQFIYFQF